MGYSQPTTSRNECGWFSWLYVIVSISTLSIRSLQSGCSKVNIHQQSCWLYDCCPLKGGYSQSIKIKSYRVRFGGLRLGIIIRCLLLSNCSCRPSRAGGSLFRNRVSWRFRVWSGEVWSNWECYWLFGKSCFEWRNNSCFLWNFTIVTPINWTTS